MSKHPSDVFIRRPLVTFLIATIECLVQVQYAHSVNSLVVPHFQTGDGRRPIATGGCYESLSFFPAPHTNYHIINRVCELMASAD